MAIGAPVTLSVTNPTTVRRLGKRPVTKPSVLAVVRPDIKPKLLVTLPTLAPAIPDPAPGHAPAVEVAYTQAQADQAAAKVPVTLIAAGVGAVALGVFIVVQLRKRR